MTAVTSDGPATGPVQPPVVAVVLASAGRPELLDDVLADVRAQTLAGVTVVVSVPDDESLPADGLPDGVLLVRARGLAAQRNAGIDAVPDATHIFCFDDDAVVRDDYLEAAMAFFDEHPGVVALTGKVLMDGAAGDAIGRDVAWEAIRTHRAEAASSGWQRTRELYGCNFAFRPPALQGMRFDARLPLYSWLEDHDFARRAMRYGVLARVDSCVIVHRGVKSGGRVAHERLGYSQVMNPVHLAKVGSFPLWLTARETAPRLAKNVVMSVAGDETEWRRRRLRGNLMAVGDVLRGKITPERIVDIPVDGRPSRKG